ncbi:hypothetical protein [Candidatus Francisella endociliophora]|nr:hypothetical protein [Francisella sp. FSC1006]
MKKIILTIAITISLATTSFGLGMYPVGHSSTGSFPPPVMNLA